MGGDPIDDIEPISLTGMVDLTYEIDRRIRHSLGLENLKPKENPEVIFAYGESGRFYFRANEPHRLMNNYFREHLSKDTP